MSADDRIGRVRDGYQDLIRTDPRIDWSRIPREFVAIARNSDGGWDGYTSIDDIYPALYYWRHWKAPAVDDLKYMHDIPGFAFDPGIPWDLAIFIRPGFDGTSTVDDHIHNLEDRMRKLEEDSDPVLLRKAMSLLQALSLNKVIGEMPTTHKAITDLLNKYHEDHT